MPSCLTEPLRLDQSLLNQTEHYLREHIAPQAALLDSDPQALQIAFQGLGEQGWLGLWVPQEWQGLEVNELTFRAFQEQVARYSGALAFLQTQHQSAAARLAQSSNEALKQAYLSKMVSGQVRVGLGFSQLRRQGEPLVTAVPVAGGYCINGDVPWITGFGCFDHFIIGAVLPDGQAVFGLAPFQPTSQSTDPCITFSPPLQLAAMTSTNTVTASLSNWFLADQHVLGLKPAGWIHQSDRHNVLHHGFFASGCAQAGLDIVAMAPAQPFITEALTALTQELNACRAAMYEAQAIGDTGAHRLNLRGWAIDLAVRCAHAAVTVSRGAANYTDHPAQRVYREALAFTIFGQTAAVMQVTLSQLTR